MVLTSAALGVVCIDFMAAQAAHRTRHGLKEGQAGFKVGPRLGRALSMPSPTLSRLKVVCLLDCDIL